MRLVVFLLAALSLQAEYTRVEMDFGGMDCASCADFIKNKLEKNPAVESIQIDNKNGTLVVALKVGNKLKFAQIRDLVEQSGYKIKETRATVAGQAIVDVGRTKLKISDNDILFLRDGEALLREMITRKVIVTGKMVRVESEGRMIDLLNVTNAKHAM